MNVKNKPRARWQLGIDAGTNSIGWAVFRLDSKGRPTSLIAGGVRLFDWGRDNRKRSSRMKERGEMRRARRRLRARKWRRDELRRALAESGFPAPEEARPDVWAIRARAASETVQKEELAACLMHMCRHRGFKSLKLGEDDPERLRESNEELNRWDEAERTLRQEIQQAGCETVGQLFAQRLYSETGRRRSGFVRARRGVGQVPTRRLVREEFQVIRRHQHALGLSQSNWSKLEDLIFDQRPITSPQPGRCSVFEEDERMPKALPSAQHFRVRQTLCDLRVELPGLAGSRPLGEKEYETLAAILDRGGTHTWASLRKEIRLPKALKFTIERERRPGLGKAASREVTGDETWELLARLVPNWSAMTLRERDDVVETLLYNRRNRRSLLSHARALGLSSEQAEELADFAQFTLPRGHLSYGRRAVRGILEHLGPGNATHEAVERVAGGLYAQQQVILRETLPYYGEVLIKRTQGGSGDPRDVPERRYGRLGNVTVHIALNEIRKIVNALIDRFGGRPNRVVVETTRELKANTRQLVKILSEQKKREAERRSIDSEVAAALGVAAKAGIGRNERHRRYRLWKRQKKLCPYTGKCIGLTDLFTAAYQIDHIIPTSVGGTDVENNLVVCEAGANAEKLNKTPWQAWHNDPQKWRIVQDVVDQLPKEVHWRFGAEALDFVNGDDGGWAPRQIRDTSYIGRVAREYLSYICEDVWATRGHHTGYLRTAWDLPKDFCDERRHFVDAAVINATDRRAIQRLNTLAGRGPLPKPTESGILPPWPSFSADVVSHYERLWPSMRPDHSVASARGGRTRDVRKSGELHQPLPRGAAKGTPEGIVRLTFRRSPEDLFKQDGKLRSDEDATAAIGSFVSPQFRERFVRRLDLRTQATAANTSLAQLALDEAADRYWGPRGIGEIRCFEDAIERQSNDVERIRYGELEVIVDAAANAWLEIRRQPNGRWKAHVCSLLRASRVSRPPVSSDPGYEDLVFVLHPRDLVAWQQPNGHREVGWLKKMRKDRKEFYVWPLRLSVTKDAAATRPDLRLGGTQGVSFSAETFRKAGGRKVTVSVLGRLRDQGPPET